MNLGVAELPQNARSPGRQVKSLIIGKGGRGELVSHIVLVYSFFYRSSKFIQVPTPQSEAKGRVGLS
jgi:hypothetical protein